MPLTPGAADQIRVRWYELQNRYEQLAKELHRILDEDTRFPVDAVYTVKHRLKSQQRLLEKIGVNPIRKSAVATDQSNFEKRIDDLLGMRIICLRMSDLDKLKEYLESLHTEGKLRFIKGPTQKKTFLIRPGDAEPARLNRDKTDIQYSGYSSVHYVVGLGKSLRPPVELVSLRAELQLRTILEEAWGEIDHKYRYELTRSGVPVPTHVEAGFRDLGLYLQAAARQADHLCEEVERLVPPPMARRKPVAKKGTRTKAKLPPGTAKEAPAQQAPPDTVPAIFRQLLGFEPTVRTVGYIFRRMNEHSAYRNRQFGVPELYAALEPDVIKRFREIYVEEMGRSPFPPSGEYDRDLDVVPLVNFALFSSNQSRGAAEAGLRASLKNRRSQRGL